MQFNVREVTLEEFTDLMMGKLSGKDPRETLREVFCVLSKPKIGEDDNGLITYRRLKTKCKELKVS